MTEAPAVGRRLEDLFVQRAQENKVGHLCLIFLAIGLLHLCAVLKMPGTQLTNSDMDPSP